MSDYWTNWPSVEVLAFVKDVQNVEISNLEPKKKLVLFLIMFLCNISSGKCFHKQGIYNLIYIIIYVNKTDRHSNVKSVENI